jgi:hypothetical protein
MDGRNIPPLQSVASYFLKISDYLYGYISCSWIYFMCIRTLTSMIIYCYELLS